MIAPFDQQARDAFRVGLREEPSRPNATQELDPNDILEVQDVAQALARVEERLRPRRSDLDVFDSLVGRRATDDAAGPARHSPVRPTPIPPRPPASTPPPLPPRPEDDAYFHPMGRIRTLADVTLEGYRPEPTILLRLRQRRSKLSWVVAAVLVPFAVLGVGALALGATAAPVATAMRPAHLRLPHVHAQVAAASVTPARPTWAIPARSSSPLRSPPARTSIDGRSLPNAKR
jgi:hypothetical protein